MRLRRWSSTIATVDREVLTVIVIAVVVVLGSEIAALVVRSSLTEGYATWIVEPLVRLGLREHPSQNSLLTIVWFLAGDLFVPLAFLFYLRAKVTVFLDSVLFRTGFGLLMGGGLANGVERLSRGSVTDMFVFGAPIGLHQQVEFYNLADLATYLGGAAAVVGIVVILLRVKRSK